MAVQMRYSSFRVKRLVWLIAILFLNSIAVQTKAESGARQPKSCKTIVIGFVGGMRSPDDLTQGVVQIGNRLRSFNYPDLQVKIYSHWHWREAYKFICQNMAQTRNHNLSKEEIEPAPKLVIYGHSLGGWAVIKLSRRLEKAGIPVGLTVQIDSVGIGDEIVPVNVMLAANFYQRTVWPVRGEKSIRAENESKTKIVGNFLIKKVGHEALAREHEISDFIVEKACSCCAATAMGSRTAPELAFDRSARYAF